eukprot:8427-Pelagococcus_subviridis.AAC.9
MIEFKSENVDRIILARADEVEFRVIAKGHRDRPSSHRVEAPRRPRRVVPTRRVLVLSAAAKPPRRRRRDARARADVIVVDPPERASSASLQARRPLQARPCARELVPPLLHVALRGVHLLRDHRELIRRGRERARVDRVAEAFHEVLTVLHVHLALRAVAVFIHKVADDARERDVDYHDHGQTGDDAKVKHDPDAHGRVGGDDGDDDEHLHDVVHEHSDANLVDEQHRGLVVLSAAVSVLDLHRENRLALRRRERGSEFRSSPLLGGERRRSLFVVVVVVVIARGFAVRRRGVVVVRAVVPAAAAPRLRSRSARCFVLRRTFRRRRRRRRDFRLLLLRQTHPRPGPARGGDRPRVVVRDRRELVIRGRPRYLHRERFSRGISSLTGGRVRRRRRAAAGAGGASRGVVPLQLADV